MANELTTPSPTSPPTPRTPQNFGSWRLQRAPWRALLRRWGVPVLCRPTELRDGPALVVSPHQDDETLGCGGMIALKRQRGIPVTVAFLTDGGACRGDIPGDEKRALVAERREEAVAALAHLGVTAESIHFLAFPDGGLSNLRQSERDTARATLSDMITRAGIEEVYVPHRRDGHADHEAAYDLVAGAVRASGRTPAVLEYPVWLLWLGGKGRLISHVTRGDLSRGHRIALGPAMEAKRAALAEYRSQLPFLPLGFVDCSLTGAEVFFRSTPPPG